MKEIKFRAWDKEDNKMIYDVESTYDYGCSGLGAKEGHFGEVLYSDNYIVMQMIPNIKDKFGKNIYIGDLIPYGTVNGKNIFAEVVYLKCRYCLLVHEDEKYCVDFYEEDDYCKDWFEIIGNIYENSELLEEK